MPHYRQQIREHIATTITGLATVGTNVHQTRVYPLETVPALSVYMDSEEIEEDFETMGNHTVVDITLHIDVNVAKATGMDDELDTIIGEVQAAIGADETLNGLAYSATYAGIETPEYEDQAEMDTGMITMLYLVRTGFNRSDPTTIVL